MRAVVVFVLSALALIVGAHAQPTCTFGAYRCATIGGAVEVCNYNAQGALVWQPLPCPAGTACAHVGPAFVCAVSPSSVACTPNQAQCVSSNQRRVCNALGTAWGPTQPCGPNQECANGQCQAVSATCSPSGAMQCTNATAFRQCSNGKWYTQSCAAGTTCGPYIADNTIICS